MVVPFRGPSTFGEWAQDLRTEAARQVDRSVRRPGQRSRALGLLPARRRVGLAVVGVVATPWAAGDDDSELLRRRPLERAHDVPQPAALDHADARDHDHAIDLRAQRYRGADEERRSVD